MKRCSACGFEKDPKKEFTKNRSKPDGLNPTCKECHRKRVNRHYLNNKAYYVGKAKGVKQGLKDLMNNLKKEPCKDCGLNFNSWQMDFDHTDPSVKMGNVSRFINVSRKALLEEIHKCDLVCANCHRNRTHFRGYAPVAQRKVCEPTKLGDASSNLAGGAKSWPSDGELGALVWIKSMLEVARMVGVSSQAVKKRCVRRGIPVPSKRFTIP